MKYRKKYDEETTARIKEYYKAGKDLQTLADELRISKLAVLGIIGGNTKKTTFKGGKND